MKLGVRPSHETLPWRWGLRHRLLIWESQTAPAVSGTCIMCKHLYSFERRCCAAFPQRYSIPHRIWRSEHDHTTPVSGDHGIQFEEGLSRAMDYPAVPHPALDAIMAALFEKGVDAGQEPQ